MTKQKDNELYEKLRKVLVKKAEGYFYNEEILEYQTQTGEKVKKETSEKNQDILDTENNERTNNPNTNKEKEHLTLLKKKVTTHYVPPDLLAVKMLVEIFGEKIESGNELEKLEYEQLLELKNELLSQLKQLN